jgi:hypothetical protein
MTKLIIFFLLLISNGTFGQQLISGDYDSELKLAFDPISKMVTGYYESYTGLDETTQQPLFSCIFYIEGKAKSKKFAIKTYYPDNKNDDKITGALEIVNSKTCKIKLPEEHGGCWNVQHFADEPVNFTLDKKTNWIQIRYVKSLKSYFYSDKSTTEKTKAYLVQGNFVCIEKIEQDWAFCTYFGEKNSKKGWILLKDLNKLV